MALFADSISTVVSSSVYNVAGDERDRVDPVRSAVINSLLSGRTESLGSLISGSLMNGQAMSQRRFLRHMEANNPSYMINGSVDSYARVDNNAILTPVSGLLGLTGSQTLRIAAAKIDHAEVDYWAEEWVIQNHPGLAREAWFADFDDATNEVVIGLPDLVEVRLPAPADLLWGAEPQASGDSRKLLFVSYSVIDAETDTEAATESLQEMLVYRMGSGNLALDGLLGTTQNMAEFYPALPIRLSNRSLTHADYTAEYAVTKAAYRKLTGGKLDDLLDSIEENESIDDIDHCFLVHGVALNTENHTAKEYLYKFLSQLRDTQTYSRADFDNYRSDVAAAEASRQEWERYLELQSMGYAYASVVGRHVPPEPQKFATEPALNTFEIAAPGLEKMRQALKWSFMEETQHVGNCNKFDGDVNRTKAKVGEYWIHEAPDYKFMTRYWRDAENEGTNERYYWAERPLSRIYIFHQYSEFFYTRLEIVGFEHENWVYHNKAVKITAKDALEDLDPSGFLVPLHDPTLRGMGVSKANKMVGSSIFLVFNSYERVREKWYEKTIFRILITVIIAAVGGYILGPQAIGILGSNAAVGAALGMTTILSATIAGAVANALAAVFITTIITQASTSLFGEKWGVVIATLASFVVMQGAMTSAGSGSWGLDWSQLMRADNILNLTNAIGDAYTQYVNADTAEIYADMADEAEDNARELDDLQDMAYDLLGKTDVEIDFMQFTNVFGDFGESSEMFLSRTLLTGSDVANLSFNMVYKFTEVSLELPKAFN